MCRKIVYSALGHTIVQVDRVGMPLGALKQIRLGRYGGRSQFPLRAHVFASHYKLTEDSLFYPDKIPELAFTKLHKGYYGYCGKFSKFIHTDGRDCTFDELVQRFMCTFRRKDGSFCNRGLIIKVGISSIQVFNEQNDVTNRYYYGITGVNPNVAALKMLLGVLYGGEVRK